MDESGGLMIECYISILFDGLIMGWMSVIPLGHATREDILVNIAWIGSAASILDNLHSGIFSQMLIFVHRPQYAQVALLGFLSRW